MVESVNGPLIAIVPMKPFGEAKQRLAGSLDENARVELSREMFTGTLRVLSRTREITRVAVVSRDADVLKLGRKFGAWAMWESGSDLNSALEQATRVAVANGAKKVLIVPADLPYLQTNDIQQMIELGKRAPRVVIAPAQRDGGTNALLVNPAGLIHYEYGEKSFARHVELAERAGAAVEIYPSETIAFDLDLPEDLKTMQNAQGTMQNERRIRNLKSEI